MLPLQFLILKFVLGPPKFFGTFEKRVPVSNPALNPIKAFYAGLSFLSLIALLYVGFLQIKVKVAIKLCKYITNYLKLSRKLGYVYVEVGDPKKVR